MKNFEAILEGSAKEHGHMCAGQVIGVRMAILGLELIGLENPKETHEIKKIIVYVEIDRCATDAITYVTGVKPGRRSLKFKDYGIMAATFVNTETNRAYRIVSTERSRSLAKKYVPDIANPFEQQLEAYKKMPLSELFDVYEVQVTIPENEWPGPSKFKVSCSECGAVVRDGKEIRQDGKSFCHYCAGVAYYKNPVKVDV